MENKLIVSPAPHAHGKMSTQRLMIDVLIALVPALCVSTYVFGVAALTMTLFSVACCVFFEWAIQRFILKGECTINNYSAVVTGVLLAYNLPIGISYALVAVGALVAIGVGKMTYGGLGKNPFNPALVGRVFLLVAFPVAMTTFPAVADAVSGATPLSMLKEGIKSGLPVSEIMADFDYFQLFLGFQGGSMGEVSAAALLLGFAWMLYRKVISWHIPVYILGTMAIFGEVMFIVDPEVFVSPAFHLFTGGTMLGAIFMATDYVTSPMTKKGMLIYSVGIAVITMLVRFWGPYPEGMSFAILIFNSVVPLIDKYIKPKRFGVVKATK